MDQSEIIVRGMTIDKPDGVVRYRLFVKAFEDKKPTVFEIDNDTILNQGQIKKAVLRHFGSVSRKVVFADFLKRKFPESQEG